MYRQNAAGCNQLDNFSKPNLKQQVMETNNTTTKGCWMMIEEPIEETKSAQEHPQNTDEETFRDTYDFYPDAGF